MDGHLSLKSLNRSQTTNLSTVFVSGNPWIVEFSKYYCHALGQNYQIHLVTLIAGDEKFDI